MQWIYETEVGENLAQPMSQCILWEKVYFNGAIGMAINNDTDEILRLRRSQTDARKRNTALSIS